MVDVPRIEVSELAFSLDRPLEHEAHKTFMEVVYYISDAIEWAEIDGERVTIRLSRDVDRTKLEADIRDQIARTANSLKRVRIQIRTEADGELTYAADPYQALIDTGDVKPTGPVVFVYQGEFLRRLRALDAHFRSFALDLGAVEQSYPVTVPLQSLIRAGYIKSFPQHAFFCAAVHNDLGDIQVVAAQAPDGKAATAIRDSLGGADRVLSPTVCYHCFETLRGTRLARNTLFTAVNQCHRHELRNTRSLSRLQTYVMRELMFFGDVDYVVETRDIIMQHAEATLKDWGLRFRTITATDPFFASGNEGKRAFQVVSNAKFELQAYLPFSDSWLAVGSFNNHQQSLVAPYEIGFGGNGPIHSGCVGYGYDRLLYAIYAQKGLDIRSWPTPFENQQPEAAL